MEPSIKIRKIQGQSASASSSRETSTPTPSGRLRRAARACEQCRSSKLRCQAPEPLSLESRCGHCAKMNLVCEYTGPPPPPSTSHSERRTSIELGEDGSARLAQLEVKVSKLLELIETKIVDPTFPPPQIANTTQPQYADQTIPNVDSRLKLHMPSSSLVALADFAVSGIPSPSANNDLDTRWLSNIPTISVERPRISDDHIDNIPGPSSDPFTSSGVSMGDRVEPPHMVVHESPNASSETAVSQHSGRSLLDSSGQGMSRDEHYTPSQPRPLPKVPASSRMAAFTEPSSHEAPFRSLTYNPDTFRNSEISREGSIDEPEPNMGPDIGPSSHDGRKTPKKGGGDPIDRGIFSQEAAIALFNFFQHEIHFFMPILQEPISFDFVRHKSSFLLSTVLAIAAKYCCARSYSDSQSANDTLGHTTFPKPKHGVQMVEEETWLQIRALALSSYFQAMISKVHCLEDVQAILLLGAWGLHERGASPDPWLLTGSGYRLSRRLGIHLACASLTSGLRPPTARSVAGYKTYLALYAFDRLLTIGFGRPETEGFDPQTIDTTVLLGILDSSTSQKQTKIDMLTSHESAACIAAYVELANIARDYSQLVNITLKTTPASFLSEMERVSNSLDVFSSRWLKARSPLASKLGLSARPVKMLYSHIRLCLHSVPLKPASHPGSQIFLQDIRLDDQQGRVFLLRCLKMTEDFAAGIIQAFADEVRDDDDSVMCYAYDYASTTRVCGIGSENSVFSLDTRNRRDVGMDGTSAMRYCAMAITALVESNRAVNPFSCDMAGNLCLIAKEMGMIVADWLSETVVKIIEQRGALLQPEHLTFPPSFDTSMLPTSIDFSLFTDFDMSLQSSFFDDVNLFSNSI